MKKIAVVTSTRAEYGLLRWTIEALRAEPCFDVQLLVTGTHLSPAFGCTWRQIEADGLRIDRKVDYLSEDRSDLGIAREMALCGRLFADAFAEMRPDLLLVLGDRYELLPICGSAWILGIPIAHIAGGEHTEGALDEQIRNAVTMMAWLHFPNSPEAAQEIARMRGSAENIFDVGEPCASRSPPAKRSQRRWAWIPRNDGSSAPCIPRRAAASPTTCRWPATSWRPCWSGKAVKSSCPRPMRIPAAQK